MQELQIGGTRRELVPTRRDAIAVAMIALVAGSVVALPELDIFRGLSIDALTALRWRAFGPRATRAPRRW